MISKPRFNPILNVIFSDRVKVHPSALDVLENKSSQVLSENSCSRSDKTHSRKRNSLERVKITKNNVKTRASGLSVKTNSTRHTGGTCECKVDNRRYRCSSVHSGVRSRIQSATDFIVLWRRTGKRKNLHKA